MLPRRSVPTRCGRGWTGRGGYGAGVSVPRRSTAAGRLARLGFADPARAEVLLTGDLATDPGAPEDALIDALASAADPDLALAALARMPRDAGLTGALEEDPRLRARLAAVLGASVALGDHLARHPDHWRVLAGDGALPAPEPAEVRAELLAAVGARAADPEPVAGTAGGAGQAGPGQPGAGPVAALRVAYRRRLLALAARDLTGEASLDQVADRKSVV